ncbi:MAG: hypothetical protein WD638_09935 [Nitriliruptoraceae bacterium]
MKRHAVPLSGADVARLPGACAGCVFWELGGPCPQPRSRGSLPGLTAAWTHTDATRSSPERKREFVEARLEEGIVPGALIEVARDGGSLPTGRGGTRRDRAVEVAGFALFAPADRYAPRAAPTPRPSPDALLFATAWVGDVHRESGYGRLLLQAALREAIRLDRRAVEAYGDRRFLERACVLPATWLLHEGFEVHREHPRTPLFRLDTRRTVRWAESLEHAWDEVLAHLPRGVRVPERVPGGRPVPG